MKPPPTTLFRRAACLTLAATACCAPALAEEGKHGLRTPLAPSYKQECAACHVAYPPGLLPAASWQRLMGNLARHFNTDASLDPATATELSRWLVANAGTPRSGGPAPADDRITRSPWFVREHREVPAASWKSPSVKSAANCAACHTQAEQGDFNEHNVRIPR